MKKEYVILVIVIAVLVLYLVLRKSDRAYYELPEFAEFPSEQISKIELLSSDSALELIRRDDKWVVGAKEYPADDKKVTDVLALLQELKVTALVSQSGNYVRYDLSTDKKITVKAWAGSKLEREIDIGKVADTYGHTFVKLPGDTSIYHAVGNLRPKLDVSLDDIRDKQVLIFDEGEIREVFIQAGEQTLTLNNEEMTKALSESTTEEASAADEEETKTVWKTLDGEAMDEDAVGSLLSTLSDLKCSGYFGDSNKAELENPTHIVILRGEGKEYTISLFEKREEEDSEIPGLSSMNDSPFYFQAWKAEDITDSIQELLPESESDETDDS